MIADRFTFANVGRVAQGYANYLLERGARSVVVGYDTRFLSANFARRAADVLAANGVQVLLSDSYLPTPALSFAVKQYGADGGVMITASHNPAIWNGFKLKGAHGGSALPDEYEGVARETKSVSVTDVPAGRASHSAAMSSEIELFDIAPDYFEALLRLVDPASLATVHGKLLHDAMGGSAAGWMAAFFRHVGLADLVTELRCEPSPTFHGVHPEPVPANLVLTMREMTSRGTKAEFAACTDGDGDRLGVVLRGGAYFNSHQIFAVLLDHLDCKGHGGAVVKTFTVSRLIERLAESRGRPVIETKVGFKYITAAMLEGPVMLGGEESGGIGVGRHLPERDGILNALLLMQATAESGASLSELFGALEIEAGWRHAYDRLDLRLAKRGSVSAAVARFSDPPATFSGRSVINVEQLDGVKLNLERDAWLLVRPSGTEPLLRVYCEAPTEGEVAELLRAAERLIRGAQ